MLNSEKWRHMSACAYLLQWRQRDKTNLALELTFHDVVIEGVPGSARRGCVFAVLLDAANVVTTR